MDLKTRMEVLPCGKCEDMISCDNCLFQKDARELYKQIRAEVFEEVKKYIILKTCHSHVDMKEDFLYAHEMYDWINERLKELKINAT